MRIGHVTTHFLPVTGGQESYIANLLDVLDEAGHASHVYQWETGVRDPRLRTLPRPPGWLLRLREGAGYWLFNALLPLRAPELAREDLVIVHFPFHWPAVAWHRRALVLSHGVEWDQPARRRPHRLRRWIARAAYSHARLVIANDSNFLREMGVDVAPGTRLFEEVAPRRWLIPNAVDTEVFRPSEPLPGLARLRPILVPRNIWPGRGIHLAIEAFARLADELPEHHLVVAGDFWDSAYKDDLFRRIRGHRLEGRVLFTGAFPWLEMPRLYSSAEVTVIPSLRSEGTSLAALESMACGTPVVSTDIGGLADLPTAQCAPEAAALGDRIAAVLAAREATATRQRDAVRAGFDKARWAAAWRTAVAQAKP